MKSVLYKSTNNPDERVNFETALLRGMAPDYGLYMVPRQDIPRLNRDLIVSMDAMSYATIAFEVLFPYLQSEVSAQDLRPLLDDAYSEEKIPTRIEHVTGKSFIMWLTGGPT